jgi:hypothetical protein
LESFYSEKEYVDESFYSLSILLPPVLDSDEFTNHLILRRYFKILSYYILKKELNQKISANHTILVSEDLLRSIFQEVDGHLFKSVYT